jgi:hypothetical protein
VKLLRNIAYSVSLSLVEDSNGKVFELQQDSIGNYFFLPIDREHLPKLLADWDTVSAQDLNDCNCFFGLSAKNWRRGGKATEDDSENGEKTRH